MGDQLEIPGILGDERPDWDEYWVSIAQAVRARSNDPSCKVGAVIVRGNVLLTSGYNGLARGVAHRERRLIKEPGSPEKLRWMCHAEQNAIYNAARLGVAVEGAMIYTTKFPCLLCANAIIQAGIASIYTPDTKPYDDELVQDDGRRVYQVLIEAGVKLTAPNLETDITVVRPEETERRPPVRKEPHASDPKPADALDGGGPRARVLGS